MIKFITRILFPPLIRLFFAARIVGRKNMPAHGGVIIASNHLSFFDSVIITIMSRRAVSFLAKAEYFTGTGFKGWLSKAFFESISAIPVERGSANAAQDALDAGLDRIRDGEAFAMYPEGTRSLDGRLYRGKTGVAWLAMTAGVPVVPVALTGTDKIQPVGSKGIRPAKLTIQYGQPMDLSVFGDATSGKARREATDAIMDAIQKMSGQEYAGIYNEKPATTIAKKVKRLFRGRAPLT
ncbi:1-acyl-sn-glycerol-3-phosphate acyltransferase [Microbacteriaceae bacterium MWH-Ta3]|nr:1-acyl-sn-glycerol-3-phosphate acyltransferase [Microbacteriaceae bacterium MWH-Ta3]